VELTSTSGEQEGGEVVARKHGEYGPSEGQHMIRGLADAARQIAQEQRQIEETSNYFEVLRFFQNPPDAIRER
jgi:hypothetical protein